MDIIINYTPFGMYPRIENSSVKREVLSKFSIAVDLIYNSEKRVFLAQANEAELKTVNGLYMLVVQALAAQEIWHSIKISEQLIKKIYNEERCIFNKRIR